jgi:serine protease Do
VPGGPADEGGLAVNDVILEIDGQPIEGSSRLSIVVAELQPYTDVLVRVVRNGRARAVPVTLGRLDQSDSIESRRRAQAPDDLGLVLSEIDQDLVKRFGLSLDRGLLVTSVLPDSLAARASIFAGHIIVSVNGRLVFDLSDYSEAVADADDGIRLEFDVNGRRRRVTLRARQ